MLTKRVEFEEDANHQVLKGTITSVDSTTQFHMVVFNEEPAVGGIDEGSPVTVTISPNAMFEVGREEMGEDGGFDMSGLSFASGADLLVGQDVQIRPGTVSSSGDRRRLPRTWCVCGLHRLRVRWAIPTRAAAGSRSPRIVPVIHWRHANTDNDNQCPNHVTDEL